MATPGRATEETVLRNRPAARRLHAGVYLTTAFLLVSGVAVAGEGRPALEDLLGGHASTGASHRWVGYLLIAAGFLLPFVKPRTVLRFLADSTRIHGGELRWFAAWPRFLLRPSRNPPGRHEGHFDPGQRAFNVVAVAAFLALAASGIVMGIPGRFTPEAFAWSRRIHLGAMWVLIVAVAGHVVVASGVLRAYRGVGRAMHFGGRVRADLARRLWPRWADEQ